MASREQNTSINFAVPSDDVTAGWRLVVGITAAVLVFGLLLLLCKLCESKHCRGHHQQPETDDKRHLSPKVDTDNDSGVGDVYPDKISVNMDPDRTGLVDTCVVMDIGSLLADSSLWMDQSQLKVPLVTSEKQKKKGCGNWKSFFLPNSA